MYLYYYVVTWYNTKIQQIFCQSKSFENKQALKFIYRIFWKYVVLIYEMGKIPCTTIKSPEGDPPHICPPSFFVHLVYKFLHKNFINFHKYIQYTEPKLLRNTLILISLKNVNTFKHKAWNFVQFFFDLKYFLVYFKKPDLIVFSIYFT